jgi:hypothetical protein
MAQATTGTQVFTTIPDLLGADGDGRRTGDVPHVGYPW